MAEILVSAASLWEIALKFRLNRAALPVSSVEVLASLKPAGATHDRQLAASAESLIILV